MPLATPPSGSIPLYARSKVTGETFLIGPSTGFIDDLGDVDTSTTGPTGGSSLVWDAALGQWVPGPGGLQVSTDPDNEIVLGTDGGIYSNEVHVGPTGPTLSGPDLWANPDEGTLYAAATGPTGAMEWVPVGGSEVEVGDVEPTSEWEVWVDTSAQTPVAGAPPGLALDDLTDVDTTTTPPTDGQTLTYDATSGQWVPGGGATTTTDITTPDPTVSGTVTLLTNGSTATVVLTDISSSYGIAAGQFYTIGTLSGILPPPFPPVRTYGGVNAAAHIHTNGTVLVVNLDTVNQLPPNTKVNACLSWPIG